MSKILTIFIPTYNRSKYLEYTLTEFCDQINQFELQDKVEIVVSNNASTDDTSFLLDQFKPVSYIKIFNQKENIGALKNVFWGIESILNSEFLWIFGDDDLIQKGIMPQIIDYLACNKVDILTLKYKNFTDYNNIPFEKNVEIVPVDYRLTSKTIHYDLYLGFISSNIVKTRVLKHMYNVLAEDGLSLGNDYFLKAINYGIHEKQLLTKIVLNETTILKFDNPLQASVVSHEVARKVYLIDEYEILNFFRKRNSCFVKILEDYYNKKTRYLLIQDKLFFKKNTTIFDNRKDMYSFFIKIIPYSVLVHIWAFYKKSDSVANILRKCLR
jgi:glycosyltransferase involved in cell wall biosynthesis